MRVAYVITRGDSIGGAQIHVRDLAGHLVAEGHEACVFTGGGEALADALKYVGVSHHILRLLAHPIHPANDLAALLELVKALAAYKPDIISTHSSKAGLLGRVAGRILGIPTVFTAHGWAFTEGIKPSRRRLYKFIEMLAARTASRIICVSEYDRQLALKEGVGNCDLLTTIHNGMPHTPDVPLASPAAEPPRAIMVARLDEQKDHESLLRAIVSIPALEVDLVGDGPKRAALSALAEALGVQNRVRFHGVSTSVASLLSQAQLFVLTSHYEGFPRSILEAMRAGLPVVASDVGGVKESVVDGHTGFVIPRGDISDLQAKLSLLCEHPEMRAAMGQAGRERFVDGFTFQRMLQETTAVYLNVISDKL